MRACVFVLIVLMVVLISATPTSDDDVATEPVSTELSYEQQLLILDAILED